MKNATKELLLQYVLCWILFSACLEHSVAAQQLAESSDLELDRTNSCVLGSLPMEVQFRVAGNPPKLNTEALEREGLEQLANTIDARISILLKESIQAAWSTVRGDQEGRWSPMFVENLGGELSAELHKRAAIVLDLEFCGQSHQIGLFVSALLYEYFRRAIFLDDGTAVPWLGEAEGRSNGVVLILIGVALIEAGMAFDIEELAAALASP